MFQYFRIQPDNKAGEFPETYIIAAVCANLFPGRPIYRKTNQEVGVGYDAWIGNDTRLEVKFDRASKSTGNMFLERAQTFNYWRSAQPSGISIEGYKGCNMFASVIWYSQSWVVVVGSRANWLEFAKSYPDNTRTHAGANGNREGAHASGHKIPTRELLLASMELQSI